MQSPKTVHLVDYLTASAAHTDQGEIVVITIRPDKDSFRPHNVALLRSQAERLSKDLQRLLAVPAILLLLLLMSGCSAQVEVTSEQVTPSSADRISTFVAVDVLAEPSPKAPAIHEPPPQIANLVTNIHNTVINVAGDQHFHTHFHQPPERLPPTSSPIRVEAQRRLEDPRCELLRREHLERTREWRMLFLLED